MRTLHTGVCAEFAHAQWSGRTVDLYMSENSPEYITRWARSARPITLHRACARGGGRGASHLWQHIINPRAARVTVLGLYVFSRTTGTKPAYERYQQLQCDKRLKNEMAILLKRWRSRSRNRHRSNDVGCARMRIHVSTRTQPPPLALWNVDTADGERRVGSPALLLSAILQPARNCL